MMGHKKRAATERSRTPDRGVDFAWRTHAAITDWTAKVDSKASIVLTLGGALLGFAITLSTNNRLFTHLVGWHLILAHIAIVFAGVGVLLAGLVVAPRLKRRNARTTWRSNYIYFGHLRHWEPDALLKKLASLDVDTELTMLSQQLVATSKVAWYKHSMLQFAVIALGIAVALASVAVLWH